MVNLFFELKIKRQQYCKNILKMKRKIFKTWKEQFKFCKKFHKKYLLSLDGRRNKYPMIQCGEHYSLLLLENGTLFSCGDNDFGQLGLKDWNIRNKFHKVPFDKKIIQISSGDYHIHVLTGMYLLKV
jgi:hypothetical protein